MFCVSAFCGHAQLLGWAAGSSIGDPRLANDRGVAGERRDDCVGFEGANVGCGGAFLNGGGGGPQLRLHIRAACFAGSKSHRLVRRESVDPGRGIVGIAQNPRYVRDRDEGVDAQGGGDRGGREVGVNVVGVSGIARNGERRDNRQEAGIQERPDQSDIGQRNRADVSEIFTVRTVRALGNKRLGVLAADPDGRHSESERATHHSFVDARAENRFGHVERGRISDPHAVQPRGDDAALRQRRVDLGAAAVDEHDGCAQRGDLGQNWVGAGLPGNRHRAAAIFHDEGRCIFMRHMYKYTYVYAVAPVPARVDGLQGRRFIKVSDFANHELLGLLRLASFLKGRPSAEQRSLLRGRTIALLFEKPSLRTRVSFEVAAAKLGAEALFAQGAEFAIGSRESPEDAARVLSRYVDAIVIRTHDHGPLERFANAATVPVINGLSAAAHPCQALADMLTLEETFGEVAGLRLAYVGDARNNVAASFAEAAVMLAATVHFGCPPTHRPAEKFLAHLANLGRNAGGAARAFSNPVRAVRGVDAVYTDVWTSMGEEQYRERNDAMLRPYAATHELMSYAAPHAIFLHCLPAHRGEEVGADVIDGPQSAVFTQAENRMHAQKALLVALLTNCKGFTI